MHFRIFTSRGILSSPDACLKDAAEQASAFAASLAPETVVGFSQSFAQPNAAHVTVWFRTPSGTATTVPAEGVVEESKIQEWLQPRKH